MNFNRLPRMNTVRGFFLPLSPRTCLIGERSTSLSTSTLSKVDFSHPPICLVANPAAKRCSK